MAAVEEEVQLIGTGEAIGLYSDVFVVGTDAAGIATFYFYQRVLEPSSAVMGATEHKLVKSARCLARIIMSADGANKFLESLAENRGFTLVPKSTEAKEQ